MKTVEEVDARKQKCGAAEALKLLDSVSTLLVAKGKNVKRVNLKKERPDDETLIGLLLGPTGNLRAPTMKVGKTMLVGFNEQVYEETFG